MNSDIFINYEELQNTSITEELNIEESNNSSIMESFNANIDTQSALLEEIKLQKQEKEKLSQIEKNDEIDNEANKIDSDYEIEDNDEIDNETDSATENINEQQPQLQSEKEISNNVEDIDLLETLRDKIAPELLVQIEALIQKQDDKDVKKDNKYIKEDKENDITYYIDKYYQDKILPEFDDDIANILNNLENTSVDMLEDIYSQTLATSIQINQIYQQFTQSTKKDKQQLGKGLIENLNNMLTVNINGVIENFLMDLNSKYSIEKVFRGTNSSNDLLIEHKSILALYLLEDYELELYHKKDNGKPEDIALVKPFKEIDEDSIISHKLHSNSFISYPVIFYLSILNKAKMLTVQSETRNVITGANELILILENLQLLNIFEEDFFDVF